MSQNVLGVPFLEEEVFVAEDCPESQSISFEECCCYLIKVVYFGDLLRSDLPAPPSDSLLVWFGLVLGSGVQCPQGLLLTLARDRSCRPRGTIEKFKSPSTVSTVVCLLNLSLVLFVSVWGPAKAGGAQG